MNSSPVTVSRLGTWRIQDWASCCYACRFPPEEEPETRCSTSLRLPAKNMNFDPMNNDRCKESDRKLLREKKMECSVETGNDTSWPQFEEEDYIVFCFTEDGEIHIVEDRKSEASSSAPRTNRNLRPVGRKLNYEEIVEKGCNYSQRGVAYGSDIEIRPANEQEIVISFEKGEERGSRDTDAEWAGDAIREIICPGDEGILASSESSDYDQSNASRGSFAFPVLGWDWVGSPVHMPKPDGTYLKKHRARCHFLHCCRF